MLSISASEDTRKVSRNLYVLSSIIICVDQFGATIDVTPIISANIPSNFPIKTTLLLILLYFVSLSFISIVEDITDLLRKDSGARHFALNVEKISLAELSQYSIDLTGRNRSFFIYHGPAFKSFLSFIRYFIEIWLPFGLSIFLLVQLRSHVLILFGIN